MTQDQNKELIMPSKSKEARLSQKAYLEHKLNQRLADLSDRGFESGTIVKDPAIRKIRAQLRETEGRLEAIAAAERKTEEMARIKAEKANAPKPQKAKKKKGKEEEPQISKRQKKKKEKKSKGQDQKDSS